MLENDSKFFKIRDLGVMEYVPALELQKETVQAVKRGESEVLFVLQHPATYTLGRKGQRLDADASLSEGVSLVSVERGGEATFHEPGQLVAYPILKLAPEERDVHRYLRNLELTLIQLLARYGLSGEARKDATGVWLVGQEKKIASIGVALTGWVTYHGIALNVCNALTGFARIQPCGFSPTVMTSLKEQLADRCPSFEQVQADFIECFEQVFHRCRR